MGNAFNRIRLLARSNSGETITETLVATLIAGLALLMLAVVIASSSGIIGKSRDFMDNYYGLNNNIVEKEATSTTGSVALATSGATGYTVPLAPGKDSVSVTFYYDSSDNLAGIVAYERASS